MTKLPQLNMKMDFHLDSGAFSAWRKLQPINVKNYGEYLKRNLHKCNLIANLDVIPGRFGHTPTKKQVDEAAQAGWDNLKYLESIGAKVVPIFHQGEDFKWLYRMVEEGYDYIGISPDNGKWVGSKKEWLDRVFSVLTNDNGEPIVKTHGYAVTSIDLMLRYPWASVDSMTAIASAGFGNVMIPPYDVDKNEFIYDNRIIMLNVSEKSSNKDYNKHVDGFTGRQKELLHFYLEKEGVTLEQIKKDYYWRNVLNHRFLRRVEFNWRKKIFKSKSITFNGDEAYSLLHSKKRYGNLPGLKFLPKLYFAVSDCNTFCVVMNVEKLHRRLFSYFSLQNYDDSYLDHFLNTGLLDEKSPRVEPTHKILQEDEELLKEDLEMEERYTNEN